MKHEKIFKVEDGRVKITVNCSFYHNKVHWEYHVFTCAKGKRTWAEFDHNDWQHRALSMEDRRHEINEWGLDIAGEDKIKETMQELYAKMAPKL